MENNAKSAKDTARTAAIAPSRNSIKKETEMMTEDESCEKSLTKPLTPTMDRWAEVFDSANILIEFLIERFFFSQKG